MSDWISEAACRGCGYRFADPDAAVAVPRVSCPNCGDTARTGRFLAKVAVGTSVEVNGTGYRGSRSKWFVKFYDNRLSVFRRTGRRHRLSRTFNKRTDEYHELIVDEQTGAVIREVHEPLTQHQGHGSAKQRRRAGLGANEDSP